MFLKSLSMKGFKSFADPTVLEFEPGITVVVGPNGSGKSNVVDAVTWVLGAQGPRALRSQKMEDVIFAGTSTRPALGRAEVSLTIDNSSAKLPIDMAEVTISRTLFRSGDSEYAINGVPCRLLDIQDLLSDTGVGRQQHMIVGQGQLDTILNARPEDRRAIIEEAAGVLKHRRRRERAERRLAATQENLERLGDLVREVRRQIRPLERQAKAARSHAALAEELLSLRRYLAGEELASLAERHRVATEALTAIRGDEGQLQARLRELDEAATATTAELSSRREEDLAAALGRVRSLVERTRGTAGVVRERQRALAAAMDAAADVDVVSTLESEGARLAAELAAADEETAGLDPERSALTSAEARLLGDERSHAERFGSAAELRQAEESLVAVRGRAEVLRRSVERDRQALTSLHQRIESLEQRGGELAVELEGLERRAAELEGEGHRLEEAAGSRDVAMREAERRAGAAERAAREAEAARHRSAARQETLARTLRELEGAAGREAAAGVDGVVGALVDLVEIDEGWEAAFEAAAGALVAAMVVEGPEPARRILGRWEREGATGAVLAAGRRSVDHTDLSALPTGEPVRTHVRARRGSAAVDAALDALVGNAVRVGGWEAAVDLSLDRPDLVVVTPHGDRFAASGWRLRSARPVVTASALEEATRDASTKQAAADRESAAHAAARAELDEARRLAAEANRAVDRHAVAMSAIDTEAARAAGDRERVAAELTSARAALAEADRASADDLQALAALEDDLPTLAATRDAAAERATGETEAASALEERRAELAGQTRDIEVRAAALAERRRVLTERQAEVERRLVGHAEERAEAAARRERLEADGRALGRLEDLVVRERERLEGVAAWLERDYREQVDAVRAGAERLEELRNERSGVERRLDEARERSRGLDLEAAEVVLRTDTLVETIRRDLDAEPVELASMSCPELPEGSTPAEQAARLDEQLAKLGPVNPLALEELSVLEERHRELDLQVGDVRSARRDLQEVVRTLDEEIMTSFASAAADVNEHFSSLVTMLFPGGTGRMVLTDPADLLNTGVEIEVRPMGRNVRRVSLLSGGERSLAALAFLFAVFRSRPSPFYLMDEVEAALDDVNLHRFLDLVHEFREEAQLIIVSHQKRTMETGDALYGVTMKPGGSSQVVSQKVAREPEAAAS
ncbi:MAG TPA: chromosome segregation protein SMC [Acidimicrobiales bacterium]|nr:chromosome segregation protein SMC [Acidimicrobiales bacterium]